jgi:chromosomal replication initiation ATPase DnaA
MKELIEASIVITCLEFGCTPDLIMGKSKMQPETDARRVVAYLMRKHIGMVYKSIAMQLKRDHTTVIHNINKLQDLIFVNDPICFQLRRSEVKFLKYKKSITPQ